MARDLEGGRARLGVRRELPHPRLALGLVLDRLELAAHREAHRSLEPHRTEVRAWPGQRHEGLVGAAAEHRLGAEAVPATQHHPDQRHLHPRGGDQQPGGVPDQAGALRVGADHHPGGVDQRDDREAVGVAQLQEPGGLVAGVGGDRAGPVPGVVAEDPHGASLDATQCRAQLGREGRPQH